MNNGMENNSNLKGAIVEAVAFFDLFDYPLTLNEIWYNLGVKCELAEVMEALASGIGAIEGRNGFYFLAGRGAIAAEKLGRYNFALRKFKRAALVARIFKFIPWIKLMAIGNLIGAQNLKDESDIDFFIITEAKRVWLTRWFCAGLAQLFGLRPGPGKMKDKICLSFFVSENAMDLKELMLNPPYPSLGLLGTGSLLKGAERVDIYFIYWLAGLTPIYDRSGFYEQFMAANSWLKNYLPNWQAKIRLAKRNVSPPTSFFYHDIIDLFFGGLEPWFKKFQLKIMPPKLKDLVNLDSRVVASDKVIKLHANDRRSEYREKYNRKIDQLSL